MMTGSTHTAAPEGYVYVCERSEIPQRGRKTVLIGNVPVLLIACEADDLHAVEDRCPQTGGSIAHGEVLGCTITTPTVGARYDLRSGRYLGGGLSPLQSHWLTVFPLRIVEGKVYVHPPRRE